jgi:hypothetical protein
MEHDHDYNLRNNRLERISAAGYTFSIQSMRDASTRMMKANGPRLRSRRPHPIAKIAAVLTRHIHRENGVD